MTFLGLSLLCVDFYFVYFIFSSGSLGVAPHTQLAHTLHLMFEIYIQGKGEESLERESRGGANYCSSPFLF